MHPVLHPTPLHAGENLQLGMFSDEIEAARAHDAAVNKCQADRKINFKCSDGSAWDLALQHTCVLHVVCCRHIT